MRRFETLIRQVLVLALVCMAVALTLVTIADLPSAAKRDIATLSCFAAAPPAPGSEAPISAPPYPLPGQAFMAARVHPYQEMAP